MSGGKSARTFWCYTHILHRGEVIRPKADFEHFRTGSLVIRQYHSTPRRWTEKKVRWAKRFHTYSKLSLHFGACTLLITSIPLKHGPICFLNFCKSVKASQEPLCSDMNLPPLSAAHRLQLNKCCCTSQVIISGGTLQRHFLKGVRVRMTAANRSASTEHSRNWWDTTDFDPELISYC